MSVYVIAEAGINHCGNMAAARLMIQAAKDAGADAIKFQTYVTDRICRKDNPEYDMLKRCELSYDQFRKLRADCCVAGIDFISTPDGIDDARFLDTLGMRYMKIGSANKFYLSILPWVHTPLIVSMGMGAEAYYHPKIACRMHCVSSYPCPPEQANLKRVRGAVNGITGFSDHTAGSIAAVMAVARGATIIEKHFTLNCYQDGPDHHMSLMPGELGEYIADVRQAYTMLGTGEQGIQPCEESTIHQLEARK